jgi:hypothetical protein
MFDKRRERLTRLAEEIAKRRASSPGPEASDFEPPARRVEPDAFFARIARMHTTKGGTGEVRVSG